MSAVRAVETTSKYSALDEVDVSEDNMDKNMERLQLGVEYLRGEFKEAHEVAIDRRALKTTLFFCRLAQSESNKHCLLDIDFLSLVDLFADVLAYCAHYAKQFVVENEYLNEMPSVQTLSLVVNLLYTVLYCIIKLCIQINLLMLK